jgi:hypothetical protein
MLSNAIRGDERIESLCDENADIGIPVGGSHSDRQNGEDLKDTEEGTVREHNECERSSLASSDQTVMRGGIVKVPKKRENVEW